MNTGPHPYKIMHVLGELSEQSLAGFVRYAEGCCEVLQCILQLPCSVFEPGAGSVLTNTAEISMEPKGRICPKLSWTLSFSFIKYVLGVDSWCCFLIIPSGQNFQNFSKWPLVVVTCLNTRDPIFSRRKHRKLLLKLKWKQGVHCC